MRGPARRGGNRELTPAAAVALLLSGAFGKVVVTLVVVCPKSTVTTVRVRSWEKQMASSATTVVDSSSVVAVGSLRWSSTGPLNPALLLLLLFVVYIESSSPHKCEDDNCSPRKNLGTNRRPKLRWVAEPLGV